MPFTEPPPKPPPPDVQRYTADGKPTAVQIEFENRLRAWLQRLAESLP